MFTQFKELILRLLVSVYITKLLVKPLANQVIPSSFPNSMEFWEWDTDNFELSIGTLYSPIW